MLTENEISYQIRGAIYDVYNALGAGLLESVYVTALEWELVQQGLRVRREVPIPVYYKEVKMELGFRLDLLIEEKVIIEVKSVETLAGVHHKQILTYLRLADKRLGILVNFNVGEIRQGIFRKVNGL
jgi:GxxExxY protein